MKTLPIAILEEAAKSLGKKRERKERNCDVSLHREAFGGILREKMEKKIVVGHWYDVYDLFVYLFIDCDYQRYLKEWKNKGK